MRILFLSFFIVLIDQITKLKIKGLYLPSLGIDIKGMRLGQSIPVMGDFFKFTFIENPGMAFGLEIGGKLTLSIFTIIATGIIIYLIYKNRNESLYLKLSLAFILGGAMGNLIDRIFYGKIYGYAPLFYGKVVDFFHFNIPDFNLLGKTIYSFPIFNIADISVTAGFIMIVIGYKKIFTHKNSESIDKNGDDINDENISNNSYDVMYTNDVNEQQNSEKNPDINSNSTDTSEEKSKTV